MEFLQGQKNGACHKPSRLLSPSVRPMAFTAEDRAAKPQGVRPPSRDSIGQLCSPESSGEEVVDCVLGQFPTKRSESHRTSTIYTRERMSFCEWTIFFILRSRNGFLRSKTNDKKYMFEVRR